ncbi:MAG: beta strand repeat-containing protein, partial [Cetobacterium sp.]
MKELKLLKGLLKKRTKLTLSTLVIFLITGSIGYSIEITENFINEGSIVEIDGNGVNISSVGINIINSGIISGESITSTSSTFSGNGVYSRSSIGTITNSGIISGESTSSTSSTFSGNGVSTRSSIGTITNSGIIGGKSTSPSPSSGNGVYSNSSIEIITNSGIISGGSDISSSGNGVYSSSSIGTITNSGIISGGWSNTGTVFLGNGVDSNSVDIINSGIISGESISSNYYSGNGVYNNTNISLGDITNSGIISGESTSSTFSGNGVSTRSSIGTITNSGIIKGSNKSIQGNYISLTNNGILAGKQIHDISGVYTNNGIEILIDSTGNITNIENGLEGEVTFEDGTIKNIINGNIDGNDSFTLANDGSKFENNIINGAGIDKGALIVNPNSEIAISNSIVNGYSTAIYLESDSKITSTDTIFNGGGLKNDIAVIKGDDGDNSLNILGNSIINGAVDLGNGTDTLAIANTVQINGNLDGGAGNQDTLNLGEVQTAKAIDSPNLNLLHDITGFESINTNGNITLFETVNLTGAENINLESGNLVLRVDPTVTTDGKVIGHALYGNNGILTSSGGNLVIGLNGLGEGAIISMGGTTITLETNDSWWKDTDHIKTNSLVLDGKLSADGKDINITVLESIPLGPSTPVPPINPEPPIDPPAVVDSLLYEKLNKVYQSIVSAEEIGNLANTTLLEDKTYNDSLGGLLTILDQIYANNPYAYSLKSSRDS